MTSFYSIPGPAGTIQVGTVTQLPIGATPTVANSGTEQAAIFNFGIPETPVGISSYKTVADASYTLLEGDRSKILVFTSSSAVTVNVPTGLTGVFDVMLVQSGTGQLTITPASGVTINSPLSATKTAYRYAVATLLPISTDTFLLSGEVTA